MPTESKGRKLPDPLPEYLTVDQTASYLQLCKNTVRALLRNGELPGKKFGNTWRVRLDALIDADNQD